MQYLAHISIYECKSVSIDKRAPSSSVYYCYGSALWLSTVCRILRAH